MWSVSSVTQSCPTFCDPMDCSMPGFPVHHQLLELTQTHIHQVSDAIQPSHPLPSPSPPTVNLGLLKFEKYFLNECWIILHKLYRPHFGWFILFFDISYYNLGKTVSPSNGRCLLVIWGSPGDSAVKNLLASEEDACWIPGLGRFQEEGNGNLL